MEASNYQTIGLYSHNEASYESIKQAYAQGQKTVGIVHATGTGKSYNALQLAYDNKNKKIVYVVPSNAIIEHIKRIVDNNPNIDSKRDFPNLTFRTYQSFISLSKKEMAAIDCDLLILDEFHHIGAPVWGARIKTMLDTHPNVNVFGMTAYTVRDRGTVYERDLANPETDELFSNSIVSRYDLSDAMIDGVLPKPVYKTAYINLLDTINKLEEKIQRMNLNINEYREYMKTIDDAKRRIHEAPSIPNILRKSIKPNGKYIYFCPPFSEDNVNDIETIKKQAIEWFKQIAPEEDIVFYTSTAEMGEVGRHNRDAFYEDLDLDGRNANNKLRVMFAINQYNEGIHAPNIDGVIMGRGTTSDIVYFEQLGRALSVRGNTKEMFDELETYSIEELIEMCKSRDIPLKENIKKEDLIEKLIAPVVIDLTNNYDFIKELENNLGNRIRSRQKSNSGNHREIRISDASFDIEIEDQDIFETLQQLSERLFMSWESKYELAEKYYEHYGNLLIPSEFKTSDGYTYDENGINLGKWIGSQRSRFDSLSKERQELLLGISFEKSANDATWQNNYELAKKYYEHYGNLLIRIRFKTSDGYTYDENGINLGQWFFNQRRHFETLSRERQELLLRIGFEKSTIDATWQNNYELAKKYYEHYGNLLVPYDFKTSDGYTYDENGINLGLWLFSQRRRFETLSRERQELLLRIGFVKSANDAAWESKYEMAKKYYEHYGNLLIPSEFKTSDGYTPDENGISLGQWIGVQRRNFDSLSKERQELLLGISFEKSTIDAAWQNNYELAKKYYEHYGNLLIPSEFKTSDGYTPDENGKNLGQWIGSQRRHFETLSRERQELLLRIGFEKSANDAAWQNNYELAKKYYEHYGNLLISRNFKTSDGYTYDENGINLGLWLVYQRQCFETLPKERQELLLRIGFVKSANDAAWESKYEMAKKYYEHYGNLLIPREFKTSDGYTPDENGISLGQWIGVQRRKSSSESEKGKLLLHIGMVWNVKKNKESIYSIMDSNGIDRNKNASVINHISIQELLSKISFLKANNMPITNNDGVLVDIFRMSNLDMQTKYNISLEELIENYYMKNQSSKGV